MRTYSKNGWEEVSVKKIIINKISSKPLYTAEWLIDWLKKNPKFNNYKRNQCRRCLIHFDKIQKDNVWLAFTNKGNMQICDKCYKAIKQEFLK